MKSALKLDGDRVDSGVRLESTVSRGQRSASTVDVNKKKKVAFKIQKY